MFVTLAVDAVENSAGDYRTTRVFEEMSAVAARSCIRSPESMESSLWLSTIKDDESVDASSEQTGI